MQKPPEQIRPSLEAVSQIIRDAGGEIVGRTKLQKTAYLLELAGFGREFRFGYKYYGPFSDGLANAAELAAAFGLVTETQRPASWGGTYSVYSAGPTEGPDDTRRRLAREAAAADAILLELAATAAYLAREGREDPWAETERRKPDKAADGRLERAQALYVKLRTASGDRLPSLSAV
jgi:uncharacterized protein YwgA